MTRAAGFGGREAGTGGAESAEAEFREFAIGRWPSLVRFAYGLTGDRGHAEDLAQITLAKVYAA